MKPLWTRWLCVHKFTNGVRTVYDEKDKKWHAYICLKCGKGWSHVYGKSK